MANAVGRVLRATDGTPLHVADSMLDPSAAACGGIVLMHGLGEHSGRYPHVVRFFNDCGWSVRVYDQRGHAPSSDAMVQDAKIVIDDFAHRLSEPPLLCGHSMGGLFAARFATAGLSRLRGLILSSPALAVPMSGLQKLMLKAMRAVAPGMALPNGLQTRYLSHDPAVVEAYVNDPLVHPKISSRLLTGMLAAIAFSHAHAAALTIPTLLVVAGDDHLVDASGSERFFKNLAPGIGTMHVYRNFYHEIFNEVDARCVFADVRGWLQKQVAAVPA